MNKTSVHLQQSSGSFHDLREADARRLGCGSHPLAGANTEPMVLVHLEAIHLGLIALVLGHFVWHDLGGRFVTDLLQSNVCKFAALVGNTCVTS